MGSSKDNQNGTPFGYEFGPSNHVYPQNPPEPPPGQPILAQVEKGAFMNFFDDIGSTGFAQNTYPDPFQDGLGNTAFWNEPMPHDFMGLTSSFGQQPLQYMTSEMQNLTYQPHQLTGTIDSHLTETTSPDVLAGAAALLQNGHRHRSQMSVAESMFNNTNGIMPHSVRSAQPIPPFSSTNIRHDPYFMHNAQQQSYIPKHPTKNMNINWGSDQNFNNSQGFVATASQEDRATVEQRGLGLLDCFEPRDPSPSGTNSSSPIVSRSPDIRRRKISDKPIHSTRRPTEPAEDSKGKLPQNGGAVRELNEVVESSSKATSLKKRRPKPIDIHNTIRSQSPPPSSKRRKSTASSATKLARENLTEGQKRENHIKSEQKRRTLIKEGFDDLNELVPDLRSGGFSKSAVLTMAANFLDELVEENRRLRSKIAKLEMLPGA